MMPFSLTLNPGVMNDLNRTIVVAFTEPEEATRVDVTLWEADQWEVDGERIREQRRPRDAMIAIFRGNIIDGRFQGRILRRGAAPRNAPVIRVRFDGLDEVHELRIPTRGGAEGGIYEITASVRGRIGRRTENYRTQSPLFVQQFISGRPSVCFITGTRGSFFAAARGYWPRHCDVMSSLKNLEEILEYVREAPSERGYGRWGEVNIVSHGNREAWAIEPFRPPRRRRRRAPNPRLTIERLQAIRSDARLLPAPGQAQLDNRSKVVLRGCVMGHNQELLDEVRTLFGGRAVVYAPKYLQLYSTRSRPPREGFWEQFFISVPALRVPNNRRLAELFAEEHAELTEQEAARWLRSKIVTAFRIGPFRYRWRNWPERPSQEESEATVRELFNSPETEIEPGPPPLSLGTEFEHFHWTIPRARGGRGTYSVVGRGIRWEVEIRRPLMDESDPPQPVVPDLANRDHYGRSG